ncbi:hypothetical protein D9M73_154340 [compost metagenome]|jgi:hypothetical protein
MADLLGGGAWWVLFRIEGSDFSDERIRGCTGLRELLGLCGTSQRLRRSLPTLKSPKDDMTKRCSPVNMHAVNCFAHSCGQSGSQ